MARRNPPRGPKAAPPTDDPVRAQNVLLERIQSDLKMVVEHVDSGLQRLDRKIDEGTKSISAEITDLRSAVIQNSRDIRQNSEDIRKLQDAVTTHSAEIRGLAH
jgi:hypothetical protein